jgi:Family of unknown function (DUF5994)
MTLQQARSATVSKNTIHNATPRLRLKPKAPATGYVDGAWWPHGDDLVTELPDLLAVLSVRLGSIARVTYNLAEWAKTPAKFATGGRMVRLDGYYRQPVNTIEVSGINRKNLVLLVVPTRTDPEHAHDILMSTAAPDDASTIDDLLHDTSAHDG